MSVRIVCIVEGQGDVASVPILVRRLAQREGVPFIEVRRPFRIPRNKVVRPGELERAVELSARADEKPAGVLVLLDADDDPPCTLGPELYRRAQGRHPDLPCAVVFAMKEKEAWFIAAIESLRGQRGIPASATPPADPERIRGAKQWLAGLMGRPYSEVSDQPALAALFDLDLARQRSRSFDKFWRDMRRLLGNIPVDPAGLTNG